jgi:hypothetical protein
LRGHAVTIERVAALAQDSHHALMTHNQRVSDLVGMQNGLAASWRDLHDSLKFNEDQIKAELESRRQALESLVGAMGGQVSHHLAGSLGAFLKEYLRGLNTIVENQVQETHSSQVAFNRSMEQKWGQLLAALGAYGQSRS